MCDTLPYAMFKQGDDPKVIGRDGKLDTALCPADYVSDPAPLCPGAAVSGRRPESHGDSPEDPDGRWSMLRWMTLRLPWSGTRPRDPR